ncbi:hypothetical protein U14_01868 [Candidatus Moduliflexus flocculans]|uniref:Uncharacterized protein n=1 Tax=Candidatus Moduliflexus flocculans TaxID=1499966 RepID=A0A0S6VT02_9BACT|nr:hypothetical protein U14_01868 [Candidatus Moduliflexus flocculans]
MRKPYRKTGENVKEIADEFFFLDQFHKICNGWRILLAGIQWTMNLFIA